MHRDDEELQPKELKKVRRVLGVCLWRAEEERPGSSRIKRRWWVPLLRRVLTMVDWCEEEYSSEEELDSDEEEDCPHY